MSANGARASALARRCRMLIVAECWMMMNSDGRWTQTGSIVIHFWPIFFFLWPFRYLIRSTRRTKKRNYVKRMRMRKALTHECWNNRTEYCTFVERWRKKVVPKALIKGFWVAVDGEQWKRWKPHHAQNIGKLFKFSIVWFRLNTAKHARIHFGTFAIIIRYKWIYFLSIEMWEMSDVRELLLLLLYRKRWSDLGRLNAPARHRHGYTAAVDVDRPCGTHACHIHKYNASTQGCSHVCIVYLLALVWWAL